jgi:peptidoglycan/LPS O-acetylase OafA/YrhL
MRRSLRIFPLYYTVVGIYLVSVQLVAVNDASSREFLRNLPYFLTYTSNWFGGKVGTFAFAWSLAAEEQFYSTWPWAVYFLKPRRAVWFVALLLTAAIVLRVVDPSLDTLQTSGLPARSWWLIVLGSVQMSICWGCLLAFLLRDRRGFAALWMVLGHRWTGVVVLPLTLLTLASPSVPVMTTHFLSAVLVGACVIREDTALARVARPTWVAHIGIVSYGMYLLHGLVYSTLGAAARRVPGGWTPHSVSGFVAATLFTTAAATISFRYFESPFLRLKARFSGNRAAAVTS